MSLLNTQRYLYAYTTPKDSIEIWKGGRIGIGLIKIGQTNNPDVEKRIKSQLGAGNSSKEYILLFKQFIGKLSDKDVHKVLKNSGVHFIENTEWAECSIEEVEHAVTIAANGGVNIPASNMCTYGEQNIRKLQNYNEKVMNTAQIVGAISTLYKDAGLNVSSSKIIEDASKAEKILNKFINSEKARYRKMWQNQYRSECKQEIDAAQKRFDEIIEEVEQIKENMAEQYCDVNFDTDSETFINRTKTYMRERNLNGIIESAYICNTLSPKLEQLYKELRRDLINNFSLRDEWDTGKVAMKREMKGGTPIYRFTLTGTPFKSDMYKLQTAFKLQNPWLFKDLAENNIDCRRK